MKGETIKTVKFLLENEQAQKALETFEKIEAEDSVEYYLLKGQIAQKFQNWGEAMNAFHKVLDMDQNNEEALSNLEHIRTILNFWNPEMFNP